MSKKNRTIIQPVEELEIINRRTHKIRKIKPYNKEVIIYNQELCEFQLLSKFSSSYDLDSESCNG
tara:strand:+ start:523 stop:717 length:195 start_codon:yes stop_codon:yes gene_type:complete